MACFRQANEPGIRGEVQTQILQNIITRFPSKSLQVNYQNMISDVQNTIQDWFKFRKNHKRVLNLELICVVQVPVFVCKRREFNLQTTTREHRSVQEPALN